MTRQAKTSAGKAVRPQPGTLEREAQRAAAAGPRTRGLARGLSPTKAAVRPYLTGPGQPLPEPLRARAETRFGADLAAVRLHFGAEVPGGARAAAAGSDILIADSALPVGTDGERLALHEIAHTLQQTARLTADGRLAARRVYGRGPLHAEGGELPVKEELMLDFLISKHLDGKDEKTVRTTDPDLADMIALLRKRFGGTYRPMTETDAATQLDKEIVTGELPELTKKINKLSLPARSLLFDMMKIAGYFGSAYWLLDDCWQLKTVRFWSPFHEWVGKAIGLERQVLWGGRAVEKYGPLKTLLSEQLPHATWNYMIDPNRSIQSIYNYNARLDAYGKVADDWQTLSASERVLSGFVFIHVFERNWLKWLGDLEKKVKKASSTRVALKATMSLAIEKDVTERLKSPDLLPPMRAGFETIVRLAGRAKEFWVKSNDQFVEIRRLAGLFIGGVRSEETLKKLKLDLPDTDAVEAMRIEMEKRVVALFAVNGNSVLSDRDYSSAVSKFRNFFARHYKPTKKGKSRTLSDMLRKQVPKTAGGESEGQMLALAVLYQWFEMIDAKLAAYQSLSRKKRTETADARLSHRADMARLMRATGVIMDAPGISDEAEFVLEGTDIFKSTLILISDWEKDDKIFTKMGEDLTDKEVKGVHAGAGPNVALPISIRRLVQFYRLVYDRALAESLKTLLTITPTKFDPKRKPIIHQAIEAAGAARYPERYHVEQNEFIKYEDDETDFSDLLALHPKTRSQLLPKQEKLGALIGPKNFRRQGAPRGIVSAQVFVWRIPPLDGLVDELKKIDDLNKMIGPTVQAAKALAPADWIKQFVAAADKLPDKSIIETAVKDHLKEARRIEKEGDGKDKLGLDALIPAAISHERRSLAPILSKALDEYAKGDIRQYERPNQVLTVTRDFSRFVVPPGDQPAQTAALIAAMAPSIKGAFIQEGILGSKIHETRFDIITGWMALLKLAYRMTTAEKWPEVERILARNDQGVVTERIDWAAAHKQLGQVIEAFEEQAAKIASQLAMWSDGKRALKSNLSSFGVKVGEPFVNGGVDRTIVQIHREFIYLPPYGKGDSKVRDAKLLTPSRKEWKKTSKALVTVKYGSGNPFDITDDLEDAVNLRALEDLARIVSSRAHQLSLQNSAAVIDAFGEFLMDAVSCVPGVGQAAAVAKILADASRMVATGELTKILELVRGDPLKLLEETIEDLTENLFKPELVWNYLLFDDAPLEKLKTKADKQETKGRTSRFREKGLKKVVRKMSAMGTKIHGKIHGVKRKVTPRVRGVQFFIAARPKVAKAIDFASIVAIHGQALIPDDISGALRIEKGQENIAARLNEMVNAVNDFELPQKIVDPKEVVDAIFAFIIAKIPGCAGFLTETFLDVTGIREEISGMIAAELAGTGLDPNDVWIKDFRPKLETAVEDAKKELIASLNLVLSKFGLPAFSPSAKVDLGQSAYLQVEGHDAAHNPAAPPIASLGPGQPLPGSIRTRAERGFGHDFGHVRVHRGADAAALTAHYGADALTSGSHVLLSPGTDPHGSEGGQVLRHELAHVLQQTGPRPLDADATDAPRAGGRGGLRIDAGAEAEADRLADAAGRPGHRIGDPLAVSGQPDDGWAPAMGGRMFAKILKELANPTKIDDFAQKIEAGAKRIGNARVGTHETAAKKIWSDTWQKINAYARANGGKGFRGHTKDNKVPDAIKTYLTGSKRNTRVEIEKAIPFLTYEAETKPETAWIFDEKKFAKELAGYVYALSGISLNIMLEKAGKKKGDRTYKFKDVAILSVDAGRVSKSTDLWDLMIANTDEYIGEQKARSAAKTGHWEKLADNQDKLQRMLRTTGPRSRVMHGSKFRLGKDFLETFFIYLANADKTAVPTWKKYTHENEAVSPGEHQIKVGTHKQMVDYAKPFNQGRKIPARESHHVPQFLLIQYFRNQVKKDDRRLFRPGDPERSYLPGFEPSQAKIRAGYEPTGFSHAGKSVDLKALHDSKSERGLGQPAISLAGLTHKRGGLHVIHSNIIDDRPGSSGDQSDILDKVFHGKFIAAAGKSGAGSDYQQAVQWANDAANVGNAGPQAVHKAMKDTYHWIYTQLMYPKLETALETKEVSFYTTAAMAQSHSKDNKGKLLDAYNPQKNLDYLQTPLNALDKLQDNNPMKGFR